MKIGQTPSPSCVKYGHVCAREAGCIDPNLSLLASSSNPHNRLTYPLSSLNPAYPFPNLAFTTHSAFVVRPLCHRCWTGLHPLGALSRRGRTRRR